MHIRINEKEVVIEGRRTKIKKEELEFKKKTAKLKLHFWQQITPDLKELK